MRVGVVEVFPIIAEPHFGESFVVALHHVTPASAIVSVIRVFQMCGPRAGHVEYAPAKQPHLRVTGVNKGGQGYGVNRGKGARVTMLRRTRVVCVVGSVGLSADAVCKRL